MPVGFFSPSFTACCRRTRTSDEMSVRDGLGDAIPDELEATVPTPSSLAAPSRRPVGYTHVRLCTRMHVRTSMGPSRRWPVRCSLPAPPFAATEPCFGFVPDGTCFMQLLVATHGRPLPGLPARRRSRRSTIGPPSRPRAGWPASMAELCWSSSMSATAPSLSCTMIRACCVIGRLPPLCLSPPAVCLGSLVAHVAALAVAEPRHGNHALLQRQTHRARTLLTHRTPSDVVPGSRAPESAAARYASRAMA